MGKGRIPAPPASRRGRPAKPEEEKTWKLAPTKMPLCPSELQGAAREEWRRLEPCLVALNRVGTIDQQALTGYCVFWERFGRLMTDHFTDPNVQLSEDGRSCEVIHPLLPELLGYAKSLHSLAAEFGLTARSRDLDNDDPRRIPSALKRIMGNKAKIAESKIPESVVPMLPEWDRSELDPPFWLNARASEFYDDLGRELEALELFTPLDRPHLCVLAALQELFLRANDQLRDDYTHIYDDKTGDEVFRKAHPLHLAIRKIGDVQKDYWTAYGMTPRARMIFDGEKMVEQKARPIIFTGRFG